MMATRMSIAPQRNVLQTGELEKLEQSITLTLQEIDRNFSRAHNIVTTSVLPAVQQFAKNSHAIWDSTKFWKDFFEASASVSLGTYEAKDAPANEEDDDEEETTTTVADSQETTTTTVEDEEDETTASDSLIQKNIELDQSDLSSPSHTSTPRPNPMLLDSPQFANYPSPYETLKRQHLQSTHSFPPKSPSPTTPTTQARRTPPSRTPASSPFQPPASSTRILQSPPKTKQQNKDPLIHRILDKTYKLQATPHTHRKVPQPLRVHSNVSSLSSSPTGAPPELPAEIFSSPFQNTPKSKGKAKQPGLRTPGVSVLDPFADKDTSSIEAPRLQFEYLSDDDLDQKRAKDGAKGTRRSPTKRTTRRLWDSSSDSDELTVDALGISPPKTIQFHVPVSRLLRTPAREASRRIVKDLLLTAGAGADLTADLSAHSPSTKIETPHLNEDEITF